MMTQPFTFGYKYQDAHLAKLDQSPEDISTIHAWTQKPHDLLVFCGNAGTGKTYFCAAFHNYLQEQGLLVRTYNEMAFFEDLRDEINRSWDAHRRINTICDTPYVILDDMGSSTMTEWQKEMLFHFVDQRCASKQPTVITTNLSKRQIRDAFHERFYSRLFAVCNTVIKLDGPDRRQSHEST